MFATEPTQPQEAPGIIEAALRYRRITIGAPVAVAMLAFLFTLFQPASFTAEGSMTLSDPRGSATFKEGTSVTDFARYTAERANFATSSIVLESASESFPRAGGVGELRGGCTATPSAASSVVTVSCTFAEERTALGAVEAIIGSYRLATSVQMDGKAEQALDALAEEIDALRDDLQSPTDALSIAMNDAAATRLASLEQRSAEIRTTQALFGDGVDAAEPARVPAQAGFISKAIRNMIVGGILGLLGAVLVAWFRADRAPIGELSTDVSNWLDLPLLGEVDYELVKGNSIDMVAIPEPGFQRITSNLEAVLGGETVLFTPAQNMEHDEDVVIKTALVAARAGKRVLLIDADHGARAVSTILGLPNGAGFSDFVAGEASAEEATVRLGFGRNAGIGSTSLYLMGPGGDPGQAPVLLRSADVSSALTDLRRHYDLILIDGPPLLSAAGSAVLGQAVDGVVVVLERGTSRTAIEEARRQLNFLASDTLGFVFVHGS